MQSSPTCVQNFVIQDIFPQKQYYEQERRPDARPRSQFRRIYLYYDPRSSNLRMALTGISMRNALAIPTATTEFL